MTYSLLDSGQGRKLERFGSYILARPAAQAVWQPRLSELEWSRADAIFSREGENRWLKKAINPETWNVQVEGITFSLSLTDFGHLGIFPEQRDFWNWLQLFLRKGSHMSPPRILNLFAYSGGSTLAAASAGAQVCHLDASKGMVSWARENASLNNLTRAPIRWIIEDVSKFLKREIRRGSRYEAIILDPPSFGRGAQGEIFKIEEEIVSLLHDCRTLLSDKPLFVFFSCHTSGFSALAMQHLLQQMMEGYKGKIDVGELVLRGSSSVLPLPSGTFARWQHES